MSQAKQRSIGSKPQGKQKVFPGEQGAQPPAPWPRNVKPLSVKRLFDQVGAQRTKQTQHRKTKTELPASKSKQLKEAPSKGALAPEEVKFMQSMAYKRARYNKMTGAEGGSRP